jgi:hypothetical protein
VVSSGTGVVSSAVGRVVSSPTVTVSGDDVASRVTTPPPVTAATATAPAAQFEYGDRPTAVADGSPATTLALTMSGVSYPRWTWGGDRWLRAEGSTPSVEAGGAPLGATNVVVLRVDVVPTDAVDPAGNPVPETVLRGSGEALVASQGHTIPATWTKIAAVDPVALTTEDGDPVTLARGTTWVELVPNGSGAVSVG